MSAAAGLLAYRPFREDDLPGVLRLWEEESGWGAITPERWRKWYVDRPDGPCLVAVAEDGDGRLVGQAVFAPTVVRIDGEPVPAVRLGAPILARETRRGSIRSQAHPMVQLYRAGARASAEAGFRLLYAVPEHAWLPFFRWFGEFRMVEHPCAALPVGDPAAAPRAAAGGVAAAPAAGFGAEHEALWERAVESFPIRCAVDRGADRLHHRIAGHLVLEARDEGGALVGYAALRRHDGLVEDVLARTPAELAPLLAAVGVWLAEAGADGPVPRELKAMDTPALRPALSALGFAPLDYRFAFVCTSLDPSLSADRIHPERWYLTPGD
ncbi:MAG TPA: hypothetical protein VFX98_08775 [Longimicrobiaceae bacterium]|nr:hypothetical protein [Longimicrobiaceae bacterium]